MRPPSMRMRGRILHGLVVFVFFLVALSARVGWLQMVRGEELSEAAVEARTREIQIQPRRGVIMDSEGRELAVSVDVDSLYAVPAEVRDPGRWAALLSPVLGMEEGVLGDRLARSASFVWIKRKLSQDMSDAVRDLGLSGLYFTKESERFYPKGSLAAQLLGFAGLDSQGLEGIEHAWDHVLRGEPGSISMEFDAEGREIPQAVYHHVPPVQGNHIYLSIDEVIQYVAERELARAVIETGAEGGQILLMEPSSGRVLAMASYPTYDLNRWSEVPPVLWRNPIISDTQHPGSVFKPITAAAAVEEGVVSPQSPFYDPGYVRVPGAVIHNWNRQGLGSTDFREGFTRSANVIFVKTAQNLGMGSFYRYLRAFGFQEPTGIRLPGEAEGLYPPEDAARPVDLAVMAFGQTLTTTPIQMISAISAIANGGYLMRPQVVDAVECAQTGVVEHTASEVMRRVISTSTADVIRELMVQTVEDGTGSRAQIPGYVVAGKTGTAQKTVDGRVARDRSVASFTGFAPAGDPVVVCYVALDEPAGVTYGGVVAAPVFQAVVQETLRYLEIPPDFPDELEPGEPGDPSEVQETPLEVPNVVGMPVREAEEMAAGEGLHPTVVGSGEVVKEQFPPGGTQVRPGSGLLLYTDPGRDDDPDGETVRVPDLSGMTLRAGAEKLSELGVRMEVSGSGIIIRQEPAPGTQVQHGTIVHLYLGAP